MKIIISFLFFSLVIITSNAQKIDYNIDNKYIANGYDVVAYFNSEAVKGNSDFSCEYDGVNYRFKNKTNLETFTNNPKMYVPQYGGWCAYAMGDKGEKVSINPKTFEIRNGKLYLFYNAYFTNTLDDWLDEGAEKLKIKADKNWNVEKYKNN
jgi:YHS domain-containing protein